MGILVNNIINNTGSIISNTDSITSESNNDYSLEGGNNITEEEIIILSKELPRKAL